MRDVVLIAMILASLWMREARATAAGTEPVSARLEMVVVGMEPGESTVDVLALKGTPPDVVRSGRIRLGEEPGNVFLSADGNAVMLVNITDIDTRERFKLGVFVRSDGIFERVASLRVDELMTLTDWGEDDLQIILASRGLFYEGRNERGPFIAVWLQRDSESGDWIVFDRESSEWYTPPPAEWVSLNRRFFEQLIRSYLNSGSSPDERSTSLMLPDRCFYVRRASDLGRLLSRMRAIATFFRWHVRGGEVQRDQWDWLEREFEEAGRQLVVILEPEPRGTSDDSIAPD